MKTYTVVKVESVNVTPGPTEELRACRVCLETDTKLFNLHHYKLAQSFGDVTGTTVSPTDGLPQHICNICGHLLQKSAAFRAKCREAHVYLQDMMVQMPQITTDYIRDLDRTDLKIPLIVTNTLNLDYIPEDDPQLQPGHTDEHGIKTEAFIEFPPVDSLNDDISFVADDFVDDPDINNVIVEARNMKDEDDFAIKGEGYSLRKNRKRKKVLDEPKVKKKSVKREKEFKGDGIHIPGVEILPKKRMYNRKTEEDFVSFSKMYNVEVVFLTKEQQLQEVQSRRESEDFLSARFQCDFCYRSFMKEGAYKKHMVTHDPSSGSHVCDICQVRFPVRHKLMKHLRRHKTHFICKFCNQISKDSTMAKMHFKWHEGFKYECQHCGRNFNKPSSYMNHVRENHSSITCEVCQQEVSGTRGLTAHRAKVHSETYSCCACGSVFLTEAALVRHTDIAAGSGCDACMRPCPQCGDNFITAEVLNDHLEKEHKDKIFRCEQCNATYTTDRQLGVHWTRAHKGQRRAAAGRPRDGDFMCEVCAKSYPSETTLRYHLRVHTGEKPFPCPMCPKRFRMKTNLQVHMNTHTGARPYKCALCPETFKSYSQKHKHRLLVHTKERRHKCHMCDKTYVVSFDLKMHIRTVHMKIPLPPRNRRRNRPSPACNTRNILGNTYLMVSFVDSLLIISFFYSRNHILSKQFLFSLLQPNSANSK